MISAKKRLRNLLKIVKSCKIMVIKRTFNYTIGFENKT